MRVARISGEYQPLINPVLLMLKQAGIIIQCYNSLIITILICAGNQYMTITNRIEVNPKLTLGKHVIRGTRIPVELILRKTSEGATETDLLDAYPGLTAGDIRAP